MVRVPKQWEKYGEPFETKKESIKREVESPYLTGRVWYHDGRLGGLCQKEGPLKSFSSEGLRTCRGRNLVLAIYAQE